MFGPFKEVLILVQCFSFDIICGTGSRPSYKGNESKRVPVQLTEKDPEVGEIVN